jgi:hypothetical protein
VEPWFLHRRGGLWEGDAAAAPSITYPQLERFMPRGILRGVSVGR